MVRPALQIALLCIAATGLALAEPARGDQTLNCDAYAAHAVAQQKENLSLRCGFAGGAWSTDAQGHRAWCLLPAVGMADLTREDGARADALAQCERKQAACANYAALATAQNAMNLERHCGFTGPRWSDNGPAHRAWCLTAPLEQVESEATERHGALAACAQRMAGDDRSLANIDLQNMQQRQQQVLQMLSNVAKAMHDAEMATIRKMQ
jgi:hypothetical protein